MSPLTVAIDTGPLVGARTGIGQFTALLIDALGALDEPPTIVPYVLSGRASLPHGTRRLPYPARPALALWGRIDHPQPRRVLGGVDVVHGTNFVVPPLPASIGRVVTVHDCSPITRPDLVDPVVRSFVPVLRRAVRAGVFVHVPSHFVGEQVHELLGAPRERIKVIHHGAPSAGAVDAVVLTGSLAPLADRPFVLALATREPRKNLVTLVRAFGALVMRGHRRDSDVMLALVGPAGTDDGAIASAIDALDAPARARVIVHGFVGEEQRAALLGHATALAYPSLDEGFGLPMIEAMAAGVPVVAARTGALPEVAGDAAVLVDPLDVDGLADALAGIIDDPDHGTALRRAGVINAARFSWAASARSMVELYRDVVATARPDRPGRPRTGAQ